MPEMIGEQRWVRAELACACAKCGRSNAVGTTRAVACPGCGDATELPEVALADVLAVAHATSDRRASEFVQFAELGTKHAHMDYALGPLRCTLRPGHPLCPDCGEALVLVGEAAGRVRLACDGCRRDAHHDTPSWIARVAPHLKGWCADAVRDLERQTERTGGYRAAPEPAGGIWLCFEGPSPLLDAQLLEAGREAAGARALRAFHWLTKPRGGFHSPVLFAPLFAVVALVACTWAFFSWLGALGDARTHASWQPATCVPLSFRDERYKNHTDRFWTVRLEREGERPWTFEMQPSDGRVPSASVIERVEPEPTQAERNGGLAPNMPRLCFADPSVKHRAIFFRAKTTTTVPLVLVGAGALLSLLVLAITAWLLRASLRFDRANRR